MEPSQFEGSTDVYKLVMLVVMKRSGPWSQIIVLLLYVAAVVLLKFQLRLGLAAIGALSIIVAFWVEMKSPLVWKNYQRRFQPGKSKIANTLNEPREIYHLINVYLLWPGVFILGCLAIYTARHLK